MLIFFDTKYKIDSPLIFKYEDLCILIKVRGRVRGKKRLDVISGGGEKNPSNPLSPFFVIV